MRKVSLQEEGSGGVGITSGVWGLTGVWRKQIVFKKEKGGKKEFFGLPPGRPKNRTHLGEGDLKPQKDREEGRGGGQDSLLPIITWEVEKLHSLEKKKWYWKKKEDIF